MTAQAEICINPGLDPAPFAEAFARDGVVQIPVFLRPADAEAVATLLSGLTWNVVAPDETSDTLVISSQVIQKFGEAQVRQFLQGAIKRASRGFSFVHLSYACRTSMPATRRRPSTGRRSSCRGGPSSTSGPP